MIIGGEPVLYGTGGIDSLLNVFVRLALLQQY